MTIIQADGFDRFARSPKGVPEPFAVVLLVVPDTFAVEDVGDIEDVATCLDSGLIIREQPAGIIDNGAPGTDIEIALSSEYDCELVGILGQKRDITRSLECSGAFGVCIRSVAVAAAHQNTGICDVTRSGKKRQRAVDGFDSALRLTGQ
ncbi:hypothetical protein D3C71_1582040 [compost metagenome]